MSAFPQIAAKPVLLCDIDGVISLWGFEMNTRPPGAYAMVDGVPHFLSTRAAEHLLALQDSFDLVWCSGWEERADEHLPALLGVPSGLPYLSFDGRSRAEVSARAHWKLAAIDEYADGRAVAWVDDAFNDACWAWAQERDASGAPTLLVATVPETGLVEEHAAALRSFAGRVSAADVPSR
jgi:HAD domain in Swiss Army Knife RNA repair proteins